MEEFHGLVPFLPFFYNHNRFIWQMQANNTDHIIPRLARFHIEFEGIHPFIEEKRSIGRHGRLHRDYLKQEHPA